MVTLILHHTLAGFGLKKQDIHRIIMDIERDIFFWSETDSFEDHIN
jgi:hypothetical protein